MEKNKFIVIEGLEGSGKTKACLFIKKILQKQNIKNIILVHQPGSTLIGEEIRTLIKTTKNIKMMNKEVELLLMYAARIQLVKEIIQPALKKNVWVISDRHDLSSLAYQGGGLGVNKKLIVSLKKLFLGNFKPDLTIYLDVLPEIGLKRALKRSLFDNIEKRSINFFHKTRNSYLKNFKSNKNNIKINANVNIDIVNKKIYEKLLHWLKKNKK